MIVLDLKLVLLLLLFLIGSLLLFSFTAVSRRRRESQSPLALLGRNTAALRRQLDAAPYGLLLVNSHHAISYQNPAATRLLSPAALAELQQEVQTLPTTPGRAGGRTRTLTLPDEQTLSWWICPLERGALVLLEDLSQQRQLEKTTQIFLGSLSHELRTPLTAVLAHIEVLRTPDLPDGVRDNSLHQIQQETSRIARLVQNLLTLSRLEAAGELNLRPTDLTLLTESVISDIILVAEEKAIRLSLEAESNLPRVLADPDRLKQVLLNVLDNAVKYGRVGDKITVQLHNLPEGIQLCIQDTGPGIPPQHLPHVTDRLYRARTDVEGSGLGLAIAAEILRRHHSRLHIESQAEGATGTTVRFVLPRQLD